MSSENITTFKPMKVSYFNISFTWLQTPNFADATKPQKSPLLISLSAAIKHQHKLDFINVKASHSLGFKGRPVAVSPLTSAAAATSRGSDFNTWSSVWVMFFGGGYCTWASSLPLTHSLSLPSFLPQKSWKKRDPRWLRQTVRFCKVTALIMSLCYSDTRSARPPHWPRSRPLRRGRACGGAGSTTLVPPLPSLALNKEMEGPNAKVGGSSLEKGAAKTPPRLLFWGSCIRQANFIWDWEVDVREARQVVILDLLKKTRTHKHNVQSKKD